MWLLEEVGAYHAWRDGATICDPNHGGGSFVAALFELARRDGISLTRERVSAVCGCELNPYDKPRLLQRISGEYGAALTSSNFTVGDVLSPSFDRQFDMIVGNPPWSNFSALPASFRNDWADKYLEYGLVRSRKDVLLGASRADIATLVVKKVLDKNLHHNGVASLFLPLSIFFNSGANDLFRPYPGSKHGYAVSELWDFAGDKIFDSASTRYGAAKFIKSEEQKWPVLTHVRENGDWVSVATTSSDLRQGFWQRHDGNTTHLPNNPHIMAAEGQQPRQGLNTCGANDIFLFAMEENEYRNGLGELVDIESDLIYPLIDKDHFSGNQEVRRMVLVPHDRSSGRPLTIRQLALYPKTLAYLASKRFKLESRKGTMLNAHIKRGQWWALLGVGSYSFAPWKVVWEALGKSVFKPIVFPGFWQGNQALHAYCPCASRSDADRLIQALMAPSVEAYLQASAMGGTMNWAQPGRVGKLFTFSSKQTSLFA